MPTGEFYEFDEPLWSALAAHSAVVDAGNHCTDNRVTGGIAMFRQVRTPNCCHLTRMAWLFNGSSPANNGVMRAVLRSRR